MAISKKSPDRKPDFADIAVQQWQRERPDLDFGAMGTLARFGRLYLIGGKHIDAVFAAHGLDRGEFDVLASLRRTGLPHEMTPSALADILLVSRAGMTKRIDRLADRGLVSRHETPEDRRSLKIRLTPAGKKLVDAAVVDHTQNENRLLQAVSPQEAAVFDDVLRRLLSILGE